MNDEQRLNHIESDYPDCEPNFNRISKFGFCINPLAAGYANISSLPVRACATGE
jgi:hypothetical protein